MSRSGALDSIKESAELLNRLKARAMPQPDNIPWESISDYVLACGTVREPYRFSVNALRRMRSLVRFDGGVVLMLDGNRKIVRSYFSNIPKRMSSLYLEYFSRSTDDNELFALNQSVDECPEQPSVRLINWHEQVHSGQSDPFIEAYIKPLGLKQSLSFWLNDLHDNPATAISLDRTDVEPFSPTDIQTVGVASAHLNNLYKNLFVRPQGQVRIWDGVRGAERLSPREQEVLELLCQGVKPTNIARILFISQGTANKHIGHIYQKLGVGSRQELLVRLLGK